MASNDITRLLRAARAGDSRAGDELLPLVYSELRRIAAAHFRQERPNHTLQPTALVHDAYLRLSKESNIDWRDRVHFFSIASRVMRRILVDHARRHRAAKRRGNQSNIGFDEALEPARKPRSVDVIALDLALDRLAKVDPRQVQVVEMKFFGGMEEQEIADVLGISSRTVKRDWQVARAWLYQQLEPTRH